MSRPPIPNPPSLSWGKAGKRSDPGYEFSLVYDPSPCFAPHPAFRWMTTKHLKAHFNKALDKLAPLRPIYELQKYPTMWHSPPPSGADNRVGLVVTQDTNGKPCIFGSNFIQRPKPSGASVPNNIVEHFRTYEKSHDATKRLIAEILCACADDLWLDTINTVESAGERFRTMPIYVAVVGKKQSWFYFCNAIVEGDTQADFSLEFFGEVLP